MLPQTCFVLSAHSRAGEGAFLASVVFSPLKLPPVSIWQLEQAAAVWLGVDLHCASFPDRCACVCAIRRKCEVASAWFW